MRLRRIPLRATLTALLALGCGGGGAASSSGPAVVDAPLAPSTAADPPSYTPPPAATGEPGGPVGLATSGGHEQAEVMAVRFLEALRDGDERGLRRLLDERLARAQPRLSSARQPRDHLIEVMLRHPRRGNLGPDTPLEELVRLEGVEVTPLRDVTRRIPDGLEATDLHLTIPLTAAGRRVLRFLLPGWAHQGALVIRTGVAPRIVGL
ncbi:MAG TPA: hypothetical protein RMH85_33500 [Polyangiaceae bacterium LLY-WYZ-15_(1-7)]|nr:hypothetical protein [Myxococcales bacterium]MAT24945.1 hypothetical protein [Sandaracinus sp.]HJL06726.1 hypothetical protein [Polyangiaceae bacterium LLY-WYZ-15_(1-7)]MBJ72666.1 hypothetical protein [Sandaracinus sp.]HJL13447.1 hypothetical protein [Polyangiaceae bacterium LLY-WYZ-15_(1-7)]